MTTDPTINPGARTAAEATEAELLEAATQICREAAIQQPA